MANRGSHFTRRAVIYLLRTDDRDRDQRRCLDYCRQRQYMVVAVTIDSPPAHRWADTVRMLTSGEAEIIVVPDPSHLPPDRIPRVETADMPGPLPRQRRARIINPPAGR